MDKPQAPPREACPERVVPVRTHLSVFLVLEALTVATLLLARIGLGPWNVVAAMSIAVTQSLLVLFFSMHLRDSEPILRLTVLATLFWFGILLTLVMTDYLTRSWTR